MNIIFTSEKHVPTNNYSNVYLNKYTTNIYTNSDIEVIYSYYDNEKHYQSIVFEIKDNIILSDYLLEKLKIIIDSFYIKDYSEYSLSNYIETLYFTCKIFKDINYEYFIPINNKFNKLLKNNKFLNNEVSVLQKEFDNIQLELKKKLDLITYKDEIIGAAVKMHEDLCNENCEKLEASSSDLEKYKKELEEKEEKIFFLENLLIEKEKIIEILNKKSIKLPKHSNVIAILIFFFFIFSSLIIY